MSYVFNPFTGNFDYTADLSGYVPYTGASSDVDLGAYDLTTTGTGTFGALTMNGNISMSANDITFANGGELTDGTNASIDPYNRKLYASNGSTVMLDWSSPQGYVNFGYSTITDGFAMVMDPYNRRLWDSTSNNIIVDFSNAGGLGASFPTGFEIGNLQKASFTSGSSITDGTNTSIDPYNRALADSFGTNVVYWGSDGPIGGFLDHLGTITLDVINKIVYSSPDGIMSIDWENRMLYASDGSTVAMNWGSSVDTMVGPNAYVIDDVSGFSTAVGYGASVTGDNSIALGDNTYITGNSATAVGSGATVTANNATALSTSSSASGQGAIALGAYTRASATYALSVGPFAESTANYSSTIGSWSGTQFTNSTANSMVLGGYSGSVNEAWLTLNTTTADFKDENITTTGTGTFSGLTLSGLTATRVPFFGTGGLISSSANFTFNSGTDALTVSGMTFDAGSITDASGTISFGNENLTTTGLVAIGTTTVAGRLINVLGSGAVTGSYFANTLTAAAQTTYGFQNILASGGSAIDGGGRIQYGIYNSITNTAGNGASGYPKMYGVYNYLRNTSGTSNGYGVYNDFAVSTTNCTATGLYNTYSVTANSTLFGTENTGTSTSGKLGGTNNTLTVTNNTSSGETWGTQNSFSLTGTTADNDTFGTYTYINLQIAGANFFYGHYNYLSVGNYTNTICGDYTSLSDAGLSATSYGNYIQMYFGGKGSISDPTVNKIGLYVDNGVIAGTDANNKAWAIYNNSSATTSGKVFLGADNRITYWGTGLDLKIYHDGTNSLIQNITGKLILGTPSTLEVGTGAAGVDYILQFNGETNDGVLTWMEDEDYFKFSDDIMMLGGENIVLDTATGTKIGTSTSQLLGFYNATPVNQPDTVSDAATQDLTGTDTIDKTKTEADLTSCKNAINAIIDRLQELGLIA